MNYYKSSARFQQNGHGRNAHHAGNHGNNCIQAYNRIHICIQNHIQMSIHSDVCTNCLAYNALGISFCRYQIQKWT